ncbi:hypothetical protein [Sphingobacterium sp. HMA12]|uniref:DUF7660 family protein n=1 Tax=Sphingobacterium sp. HMA12 TaxID=2050894 RepID=UPI0018F80E7D|nr:hypothetical protein [Sphingobacterium sp. HMA12]
MKVRDRQSFIKFLDLLRQDLLQHLETWENKTLPDFLETLATYTEDIQRYYDSTGANLDARKAVPGINQFFDEGLATYIRETKLVFENLGLNKENIQEQLLHL